jgi:hypothetical protein
MMTRIFECRNHFTVGIYADSNTDSINDADISMVYYKGNTDNFILVGIFVGLLFLPCMPSRARNCNQL